MKIVVDKPPNYDELKEHFDIDGRAIVFTYGDTVYNPSGILMPLHLMMHEDAHIEQQRTLGAKPWWDMYLKDSAFRLTQEIEAYKAQYQFVCRYEHNREKRALFLKSIATDLSSGIYGNIITYPEAQALIRL